MSAAVKPGSCRRTPPPGSLRRNRDFQLLCAGQGLSLLGSGASAVALPLLVLQITDSPLRVGLVEAVWTGALALACLPAGPVADRFDRRTVLLVCEAGRAVASAALAAAVLTGFATLPVLLAAGVVLGFLAAPFNAAVLPAVREVVPESRLATALAVNQVRGQLAFLLGPVIGGVLFEASPSWPFWLDSASYAVSAACVRALRTRTRAHLPDGAGREGWWRSFTTGIAFLWGERVLRRLTLIASAQNFVFDGVYLAIVVTAAREGASGGSVGMLTAMSAVGAMTGVVLAPRAGRLLSPSAVLLVTGVLCALLVGAMALTASALVLAVLLAGCALAVAVAGSVLTVARLLRTPARLQGRANSAIGLLFMATPPLGSSLTGLFLDELPGWILFLCFGSVLALLAAASPREAAFASADALDRSNGVGHTRAHAMD
ncbi:MFS transporter [Streptomyces roseoverticillatus]|uniref:MFS transporter n=1 Tax=Streptomyces roseoverticillatus TaxID=66429 RepID=UPI001F24C6DF|nr:MFS transporter [Streptomyces roseoverticillatus]MCF3101959.1 MFS transporter [Streptomyces roseoverticillatus]